MADAADDVAAFRRRIGKPDGIGAIHCDGGELRIGVGCYSVIPNSQHPSGFVYRWLLSPFDRRIPILTVSESGFFARATERTESTETTESTEAIRGGFGGVSSLPSCPEIKNPENPEPESDAIETAIRSTLPKQPGQRNKLVFELARVLKAVPGLSDASFDALLPLVRQWHNLAKPFIGTPAVEETLADFIHAWSRVKFPKGKEPMANIVASAFAADPPECVRHYESEPLKQLASVCRELQRATGEAPFFLATRTVGQYFRVDPSTASRWLKLLEVDRVIEVVEKGSQKTGRASRFRYRGTSRPLAVPVMNASQQPSASANCLKPPKQPSIFAKLTNADLRDDAMLLDWFNAATKRKNPVVNDTESDRLNVFAAAERALEVGDSPAALFAHIVGERQWSLISDAQENRALHRLLRLRNPEREAQRRRGRDGDGTPPRSGPRPVRDIMRDMVKAFLPNTPTATCSETASCR